METTTRDETDLPRQPQVIERVDAPIDRAEVLRYVGYPVGKAPGPSVQRALDEWIERAAEVARPRAAYRVLPVTYLDRRTLTLGVHGQEVTFRGAIGEFLGPVQLVAAFVATAGPGIEREASQQMSAGDAFAAMVVNAVGAERAEAAEAAVIAELREAFGPQGLATTLPYSPGYCGMVLTTQKLLFGLFGGEAAGVTLTDECLMRPLKSVSGLIGLGAEGEIVAHGSPCDRCELYSCAMRR